MDKQSTTDKALAAYLGFACGDALGATVEFMTPRQIRKRHGLHADMIGGGWLGLSPGQVTDDSQMSLALGRALIEKGTFDAETVAGHFIRWMDGGPPDIGNTCLRSLNRVARSMDARGVGEGVETEQERETLRRCGTDLAQGFLFARPGPHLGAGAVP